MANTDFIKRIQKRLSDKGIKISRNDLKTEISSLDFDLKALGEENVNTITQLLLEKHQNTELTVPEPEEIAASPSEEHNASTSQEENSPHKTESETTLLTENTTAITNQQKEQLITVQAQSLGVELSNKEITDISQNVSDSVSDFVSAVETINSIIKDYAQSKFDEVEQKIDASNNNLRDYINKRTNSLQRKSVEGALTTKEVLEQKSSSLKSFSQTLSATFKTQ